MENSLLVGYITLVGFKIYPFQTYEQMDEWINSRYHIRGSQRFVFTK